MQSNRVLSEAAAAVLSATKKLLGPQAAQAHVAIVGGLALSHLTKHRPTNDVDLYIHGGGMTPRQLKRALPGVDPDIAINFESINGVTYRAPISRKITPVDIVGIRVAGFEPRVQLLSEFQPSSLPWPTRDDLISMKAFSASERYKEEKRDKDIGDIQKLLEMYPGALQFPGSPQAEENKAFVRKLVPVLVEHSEWSSEEWLCRLGL